MTAQSLAVTYQSERAKDDGPELWARLEQEYIPVASNSADYNDLYQMLAQVMGGEDAYNYAWDACPYASRSEDGLIVVVLDFFVWVSDMDLPFSLTASIGMLSTASIVELERSFDVIVDGTDEVDLGFIFSGTLTPEMPCFDDLGNPADLPDITIDGATLRLSKPVTTVLRANGTATGYRYTSTMMWDDSGDDYSIQNLENAITVTWIDEDGESQEDTLDLEIPPCVVDLLGDCRDTGEDGEVITSETRPVLYFSTCTGKPIELRQEKVTE